MILRESGVWLEFQGPQALSPGGLSSCGWAPLRALRAKSVPFRTAKLWTGWIGGLALPPDTLRRKPAPVAARPSGESERLGGYNRRCGLPSAPKVGLCGRLAAGQPCYTATGGTRQLGKRSRRLFWQSLLLGPLGGALGRFGAHHTCRQGSGEFKRGKRTRCAVSLAPAGHAALSRGPQRPTQ